MHVTPIASQGGANTLAVIFETGEEVMGALRKLANDRGWRGCHFTAIGAFSDAVLAYFDWEQRDYVEIPIREQVEVLSLAGDVSVKDDKPRVHAHVVLGKRDGSAHGGHLKAAHVRPTLELIVVETPATLERRYDPESHLDLIGPTPAQTG
jgi:predicted DNA-binding protein with PD1-like motif